jgi:hypothetical protein
VPDTQSLTNEFTAWAGVHFQAAVDEGMRVCDVYGDKAYSYVQALIDGTAPLRSPAKGRPVHGW